MNTEQRQANEKYFLQLIKSNTKLYIWKDTGNVYDMSSGKMKSLTLKGYVELSAIVRKPFMKMFVELPTDYDEKKVWHIIDSVNVN